MKDFFVCGAEAGLDKEIGLSSVSERGEGESG